MNTLRRRAFITRSSLALGGLALGTGCSTPSTSRRDSRTVFNGDLYAAITDAAREEDWSHVFRYHGGQSWEDCGRVGNLKARGVGPMIVHRGQLYQRLHLVLARAAADSVRVPWHKPFPAGCGPPAVGRCHRGESRPLPVAP